ncbi:hypothetical protein RDWZM_006361 [Blomia tropicalis]|uniref:Nose resistant-to-fluoxetine protein N-terminal domain-containing protein n=1 Tax=Blomia tropicalis TaxID=40697 RepID=A0A9Q0M7Z8_BLOTA|nr:hypothetical protein RDWZM_006361 [Blomia tropicalis]
MQIEVEQSQTKFVSYIEELKNYSSLNKEQENCINAIVYTLQNGYIQSWSSDLIDSNSIKNDQTVIDNLRKLKFIDYGDYDRCLSVRNISMTSFSFDGKYCLLSFKTPKLGYEPFNTTKINHLVNHENLKQILWTFLANRNVHSFSFGICIPSICNSNFMANLINQFGDFMKGIPFKSLLMPVFISPFSDYETNWLRYMPAHVQYCQTWTPHDRSSFSYKISLSVVLIIFFVTFSATLIHEFEHLKYFQCSQLVSKVATCFHFPTNLKLFFQTKSTVNNIRTAFDSSFLFGIRVNLVFIVVVNHIIGIVFVFLEFPITIYANFPNYYIEKLKRLPLIQNGIGKIPFVMAIFFSITSFLATQITLTRYRRAVPSFWSYFIIRYLRLAPSILFIICCGIVLQQHGSGPLFHSDLTNLEMDKCRSNWWANLLMIENFWNIDQMCQPIQWFIVVNFQLYILLYPVLYLYYKNKFWGKMAVLVGCLTYLILPLLVAWKQVPYLRLDFLLQLQYRPVYDSFRLFYTSPIFYTIPFFLGALVAMELHEKNYPFYSRFEPFSRQYQSDSNEQWSMSYIIAIMIVYTLMVLLSCTCLYIFSTSDSLMKRLLSCRYWIPLDKLSYGIYLSHPIIIWYNTLHIRDTIKLNPFFTIQLILLFYVQSILLAFILYIFVELPITNVRREFFGRVRESNNTSCQNQDVHIELN